MVTIIKGKAHKVGDHIDTDTIISAKYINKVSIDKLYQHAMEALDAEFVNKVKRGDILVAGKNFGCGSSREVAPMVLKDAGISVVVADSFARIFFRNAINIGLPVLPIGKHAIPDKAVLEVHLKEGAVKVVQGKKQQYQGNQLPPIVMDIIEEGGLVNYLKKHKDFVLR